MAKLSKRQRDELIKTLHERVELFNKYSRFQYELDYSHREPEVVWLCHKGGERVKRLSPMRAADLWLDGFSSGIILQRAKG